MSAPIPLALADAPGPERAGKPGLWQRWRWPVYVVAAVGVTSVVGLLLLGPAGGGFLDPGSVAPDGSRALVRVLRGHGVEVRVRTRFDDVAADLRASTPATVVVARTDLLVGQRAIDLRRAVADDGADLVLVSPGAALLADLELPLVVAADEDAAQAPRVLDAGCADVVAARAGPALAGGGTYRPAGRGGPVTSCYPVGGAGSYLALTGAGGGRTTVLGSGAALTNDRLADEGDAALAVGTLGARPWVVWWIPNPADTGVSTPPTLLQLLPRGLPWAGAQLAVALAVAAAWRGRRLGRLVHEPLPVVVRAVETTLGRARLYRRARARGRAAQVLRAAAVQRLAARCNLPRTADPLAVAAAAADRAGRPHQQVASLLVGVDPPDDNALVTLADELDALDTEVRHP